jgi:hypothetical protein
MKGNSTPKGSTSSAKHKSRPVCDNVEREFSKRFLSLFISSYDPSYGEDPLDFPPVKPVDPSTETPKSKAKSLMARAWPFDAAVWDIRLRKSIVQRHTEEKEAVDRLSSQLEFFTNLVAKPAPDIAPVFLPEPAPRPETPLYLANATAAQEAEDRHKREKSAPLALSDGGAKWRSRVQRHELRKKAHAEQMKAYYEKDRQAQKEFLNSLKGVNALEERKSQTTTPSKPS